MSPEIRDWLRQEVRPKIDSRIRTRLTGHRYEDELLYQIETGGKRWRPALVLLVGQLCDLSEVELLDAAVGIELLHNATLVHDDIIDRDTYRRNEPTMWSEFGRSTAINIGDMMFAVALDALPTPVVNRAIETIEMIMEGQQMDIDFEDRRDLSEREYLKMTERNAGALLELSLTVPQQLAGVDLGIDQYSKLGPAFQIRDDILDFEERKGKRHVGNDVRAGKRTLMVIHADDDRIYDILDKPFEDTTPEDVSEVLCLLGEHGSLEYARRRMHELKEVAVDAVTHLPNTEERDKLHRLGSFLVERSI